MAVFNVNIVANLIDNITSRARAVTASLAMMRREAAALSQAGNTVSATTLRRQANHLEEIGRRAEVARYQLTTFGSAALVSLAAPLVSFNAVEQAFNRIAKAADLPLDTPFGTEAFQRRQDLLKGLLDLAVRLPNPIREIGDALEDVMRAGIGEDPNRPGFFNMDLVNAITERFIAAANVFGINLKDTPKKMAVLAKLFGKDLNSIEGQSWLFQIMDSIAWLDKNIPGTARNILEFVKRGAPDLKRLGFTIEDIIGLGALFESSVGKEAEQSVRTFTSGMQKVATMHLSGSKRTQKTRDTWAQWLGFKDAKDFYHNIFEGKTGLESLKALVEALYAVPKEKRDAFIRNAMGLDPMRTLGAITPELIDELERLIKLMNDPRARGTLMREQERDIRSLRGQWGLLRNSFEALFGGPFGEGVADEFKSAMRNIREFFNSLRELSEAYPGIARDIGKWSAYIAGALALYFGGKMMAYVFRIMRLTGALRSLNWVLRRSPLLALTGLGLVGAALASGNRNLADALSQSFFGIGAENWPEFLKNWNTEALWRQFPGGQWDINPIPFEGLNKESEKSGQSMLPDFFSEGPIEYFRRLFRSFYGTDQVPQNGLQPQSGAPQGGVGLQQQGSIENYYAPKQQVTAPVTVNVTVNASFQNADPQVVGNAVGNAAAQQVKTALNSALNDGVQGYAVR